MKPTTEQLTAIQTSDRSLIVEAGAGTGKTWVLVQRFLNILESHPDWKLTNITAITFTEKAAREMRSRLRRAIEQRALANPQDQTWQDHRLVLDQLQVSTIHSLCARILRENAIAAEIDPRFTVLDEQEADILKEEAIQETIKSLIETNHPSLGLLASLRVRDMYIQMGELLNKRGTISQLFENLPEKATLLDTWREGITTMQMERWQEKSQVFNVTPELLDEILDINIIDPADKLAPAVQFAKIGASAALRNEFLTAYHAWLQINRSGGKADNWGGKERKAYLSSELLKPVQDLAKSLNNFDISIDQKDEKAADHLVHWQELWARLDEVYTLSKETDQFLDFDDLEILTDRLLQKQPRPPRVQAYLDQIHHLMVDEFQDTSLLQQRIVYTLAPLNAPGKLFVVGDAKQSIYRFRQAQVKIFNQTVKDISTATHSAPVKLSTSFRTHSTLVKGLNGMFKTILSPLGKSHTLYEAAPGPLQANRPSHHSQNTPIELLLVPRKDQNDETISAEEGRIWEANWIAQKLLSLHNEKTVIWDKEHNNYRVFNFRDAAVLFRATTYLPLYEAAFKSTGIPYLTVSGRGYFDRPEVQDLSALLSALANPQDDFNMAIVLRSPIFALSDETLYWLRWKAPDNTIAKAPISYKHALNHPPATNQNDQVTHANKVFEQLWALSGRVDVWTLLRTALDLTGYEAALAVIDGDTGRQHANVSKFLSLARDWGQANLPGFLSRLHNLQSREAREGEALGREPESGAVQLMSIHAAKGLEFPVVVVADLGRKKQGPGVAAYLLHDPGFGLVCKIRDETGKWDKPAGYVWGEWMQERMEEAERKRLLYVACTRAADKLILTGQLGNLDSWLADILNIWSLDILDEPEEIIPVEDYQIRVYSPAAPTTNDRFFPAPQSIQSHLLNEIPELAEPFPPDPQPQPVAVTKIDNLLNRQTNEEVDLRPAVRYTEHTPKMERAFGYQIGNIVHRVLADWSCLTKPNFDLNLFLEKHAKREGVFESAIPNTIQFTRKMLEKIKFSTLYDEIQLAPKRYTELPFILDSPIGTLHGIIDLLFQRPDGNWVLLDWKTEFLDKDNFETQIISHRTQMAVYSQAARQILNKTPIVQLCFLHPAIKVHTIAPIDLDHAWKNLPHQAFIMPDDLGSAVG